MSSSRLAVFSLIVSFALFILGTESFNTFQSVRLYLDGVPHGLIGAVAAAGSLGLVIASRLATSQVARVGHLRAFSACASTIAAITLLQGLIPIPWVWIPLRVLTGTCTGILYVVVQSWVLQTSTPSTRGQALSLYMATLYGAQGSAQLLLTIGDLRSMMLFCIPAILSVMSILPVTVIGKPHSPPMLDQRHLRLREIVKLGPTGAVGCLLAGMILGAYFSFGPVFLQDMGLPLNKVGLATALWVIGGFTLQRPMGLLSDRVNRRILISIAALLTGAFALVINHFAPTISSGMFLVLLTLFGAFAFTLYPLSLGHISRKIIGADLVNLTAGMLLVHAIGAVAGPLITALFVSAFGLAGLMFFIAGIAGLLALFALARLARQTLASE